MANNFIQFTVRQGTNIERLQVTFNSGELAYVTDNYPRVFVGDGTTTGGLPVASKLYWVPDWTYTNILQYVQLGDIVYSIADQRLYALSANPPTLSANYFSIAKNF